MLNVQKNIQINKNVKYTREELNEDHKEFLELIKNDRLLEENKNFFEKALNPIFLLLNFKKDVSIVEICKSNGKDDKKGIDAYLYTCEEKECKKQSIQITLVYDNEEKKGKRSMPHNKRLGQIEVSKNSTDKFCVAPRSGFQKLDYEKVKNCVREAVYQKLDQQDCDIDNIIKKEFPKKKERTNLIISIQNNICKSKTPDEIVKQILSNSFSGVFQKKGCKKKWVAHLDNRWYIDDESEKMYLNDIERAIESKKRKKADMLFLHLPINSGRPCIITNHIEEKFYVICDQRIKNYKEVILIYRSEKKTFMLSWIGGNGLASSLHIPNDLL